MRAAEPISAGRLDLRPVRREVAAALVAGEDCGLAAAAGWPHSDTLDGMRLTLEHGGTFGWLALLDGLVVGDCGTHGGVDAAGTVEIGYGLAGPYRGRGLGTELCRGLTGWLLADGAVRRVEASTHAAANPASRRVLEKSGFVLDRVAGELAWYVREADEGRRGARAGRTADAGGGEDP